MKKSEILRILSEEVRNNVQSYRVVNHESPLLVVNVKQISWLSIDLLHKEIVSILTSTGENRTIEICFDEVEFD